MTTLDRLLLTAVVAVTVAFTITFIVARVVAFTAGVMP
jgi:hypothetical protein